MATFAITVYKNRPKTDGTFRVNIRLTHHNKVTYIPTQYFVKKTQMNNKFVITDNYVLIAVGRIIDDYRHRLTQIKNLSDYDHKELHEYLIRSKDEDIDFFDFAEIRIKKLQESGQSKTASGYNTLTNTLKLFTELTVLPINKINARLLTDFEQWLLKKKIGKKTERTVGPTAVNTYMRAFRALFKAAMDEYNNEDLDDIRIKHYPFRKYKIKDAPESENKVLDIDIIKSIRDGKWELKRDIQARDAFLISFYLVGMNTIDIYSLPKPVKGIITYNRAKTDSRRKDQALMKIRVEPELKEIMVRYKGDGNLAFNFNRYSTSADFTRNVNKGLDRIGKALKLPKKLTTYFARYSWATIARNQGDISTDDIALALNHSDPKKKVTMGYIETDFVRVWNANRKVLDLFKK